ncbi:MAG: DUF1326 domain-containing protein [Nitrospinota bacterium]|nr:DUF1326 domain-containing protein [Nitrospinota bacterium]
MIDQNNWFVSGSYNEACNCEAICPCRKTNGMSQGRATYDTCNFAMSWKIQTGRFADTVLDGLCVAMAGIWHDGTGKAPWDIILYVDHRADEKQKYALAEIFQGAAGGNIIFARGVAKFRSVKSARIELDHTKDNERIKVGDIIEAHVDHKAEYEGNVTCGIPGHEWVGQEYVSSHSVRDEDFQWTFNERCGFSSNFKYSNG